ncbi:SMI1/KNR4 family protein [Paenibacillus thiaminolyticus]|uniref:SMI1/KNR4 family protein n=1 Tax=Paenibacillus thiaminolyticus TaxID=49283 RepID=A0A3A3H0J9_PANTH|nr:SMI1/KNR4 family protein [Paenibacillus thiaminolyticus]
MPRYEATREQIRRNPSFYPFEPCSENEIARERIEGVPEDYIDFLREIGCGDDGCSNRTNKLACDSTQKIACFQAQCIITAMVRCFIKGKRIILNNDVIRWIILVCTSRLKIRGIHKLFSCNRLAGMLELFLLFGIRWSSIFDEVERMGRSRDV